MQVAYAAIAAAAITRESSQITLNKIFPQTNNSGVRMNIPEKLLSTNSKIDELCEISFAPVFFTGIGFEMVY